MTRKTYATKKITLFLAILAIISCMALQAFAEVLTVTQMWDYTTASQTLTEPYTVYMDSGSAVNKITWKTFSSTYNPGFSDTWRAECYYGNDDSNDLLYSYTFDADTIDQGLVIQQPYYLHTDCITEGGVNKIFMGCRTIIPVDMTVKVKLDPGFYDTGAPYYGNVRISYIAGSCNGYVAHKATDLEDLTGTGDPDYLDGYGDVFSYIDTTVDAYGYVTFTTSHGGDYSVVPIEEE